MSEEEQSKSRLRVGGWLSPHSSLRPDGKWRGAHREGVPETPPPPSGRIVPVPEAGHPRLLLVTAAVAVVLIAGSAVAAVRPNRPPAAGVSVGALQPTLPPLGSALSPEPSAPPSRSAPSPGRQTPPTNSPNAADRAKRSRTAVPSISPGRGGPAATAPGDAGSRDAKPLLAVGRTVSLAPASRPAERLRHSGSTVRVDLISATNSAAVREDANFVVRKGLADAGCVSFELAEEPGRFLRHRSFVVFLQERDDGESFGRDATFCPAAAGGGISLRSKGDSGRFLATLGSRVFLDRTDRPTKSTIFLVRPPL